MNYMQINVDNKLRWYKMELTSKNNSPISVFVVTSFLVKGTKKVSFINLFTVTVANEPYTNQLYLQKSTWFLFTSVNFDTTVF